MPSKLDDRKWPWLYERDGDLNPTWIFVTVYLLLGVVVVAAAVIFRSATAIIASLSYLATVTVALLISALPRDKAKILARANLAATSAVIAAGEASESGVEVTNKLETGGA